MLTRRSKEESGVLDGICVIFPYLIVFYRERILTRGTREMKIWRKVKIKKIRIGKVKTERLRRKD
jgi:hypothetical protein